MADNFWNRVIDLLDRQGISRKEFAIRVGISYSSIHNGAMLDSIPSADIALNIAYELHTSVEYLVYGNEETTSKSENSANIQQKNQDRFLYEKNKNLLRALEKMNPNVRQSVQDLIFTIEKNTLESV
ncbi:MAG: helix-turn-helix transcriptional regulator [Treponemataceae bacterium]|nr:helix-turn-helix transcriptional regulator [Spirochaetales bacterium]MDY6030571.1 helix-turn-helix transcriptional regulator [Treponemataceae bacterium]